MSVLLIIASILVILGVIGSLVPAMPGPGLAFIGLLILFLTKPGSVSLFYLITFGVIMVILIIIDYLAPILGAKFSGASRPGLLGAIVGSLLGIFFFPPVGIFIGAFLGAWVGEIAGGKDATDALRAGIGTLVGSLTVIILETIFSVWLAIYFFIKLFNA